jgi:CRISPR-associated protein Cmr1
MNSPKTVEFETKTPLWTGGVNPDGDLAIHPTGLLGGMRWWLEALLRGVGGEVPDPTSADRTGFDPDKGKTGGLDPASLIFGATGYRRRFRLTLGEKTIEAAPVENTKLPSKRHPVIGPDGQPVLDSSGHSKTKVPEWFFKSSPVAGSVALRITPLHKEFDVALISDLLGFMAKWSALGARAQMGFGVVKITGSETNGAALSEFLTKHKGSRGGQGLPALHQMFFARVARRQPGTLLTAEHAFSLKYDIRRLFSGDTPLRHDIMGWVEPHSDKRIGAKISVSRPYHGSSSLRLWGWVPDLSLQGQERNRERDVLQKIFSYFSSGPFRLESWREWNSARDPGHDGESRLDFFDRLRKEPWQ